MRFRTWLESRNNDEKPPAACPNMLPEKLEEWRPSAKHERPKSSAVLVKRHGKNERIMMRSKDVRTAMNVVLVDGEGRPKYTSKKFSPAPQFTKSRKVRGKESVYFPKKEGPCQYQVTA